MYDTLSMGPSGTLKARKERKVSLLLRRTSDALVSHLTYPVILLPIKDTLHT